MLELSNDPALLADPFARYAALRAAGPVHRASTPDGYPVWLVTRYRDVRAGLADPRLSLSKRNSGGGYRGFALPPALDANLLNLDAPDHTRLRRLVAAAFTRYQVESLRAAVQAGTDALLAELAARRTTDLMAALAAPLPMTVIGDLLGVPAPDRERFRAWTDTLLAPDPARPAAAGEALAGMVGFLTGLVRAKRAEPTGDLLSALVAARDSDDRLTENELLSLAFLLLWAGYENSVHLLGNSILTLLTDQGWRAGRTAPALDRATVEELLRLADPNQYAIRRFPVVDVEIGGTRIPAGDTVLLCIAAANRDPDRFPGPDRPDLGRPDNPHLSFGHGPHYCLGAPLARLEVEIALGTLFRRFPELALDAPVDGLRWRASFRSRGLLALPVRLGPWRDG